MCFGKNILYELIADGEINIVLVELIVGFDKIACIIVNCPFYQITNNDGRNNLPIAHNGIGDTD